MRGRGRKFSYIVSLKSCIYNFFKFYTLYALYIASVDNQPAWLSFDASLTSQKSFQLVLDLVTDRLS